MRARKKSAVYSHFFADRKRNDFQRWLEHADIAQRCASKQNTRGADVSLDSEIFFQVEKTLPALGESAARKHIKDEV